MMPPSPVEPQTRRMPLGLGIGTQATAGGAMGPPPVPTGSKLKKRSVVSPVVVATPFFSDLGAVGVSAGAPQKGSWFANLFNWKQLVRLSPAPDLSATG